MSMGNGIGCTVYVIGASSVVCNTFIESTKKKNDGKTFSQWRRDKGSIAIDKPWQSGMFVMHDTLLCMYISRLVLHHTMCVGRHILIPISSSSVSLPLSHCHLSFYKRAQ